MTESDQEAAPSGVEIPVCDGRVGDEKLLECRETGTETQTLDFKITADLTDRKTVIELAKDVAAMRSNPRGGYLVFGLDDHGQPPSAQKLQEITALDPAQFDEARVRDLLKGFLGSDFSIVTRPTQVDGHPVVVMFVAASAYGISPMVADGQLKDERRPLFYAGDVFVRRGTQVTKLRPEDLPRLLEGPFELVKEQTRREVMQTMSHLTTNAAGAAVARGPVGAVTWQLPQEEFEGAVLEALRADDEIALRHLLLPLAAEARSLAADAQRSSDVPTLLNRVIAIAAEAVTYHQPWLLDRSLRILHAIYDFGFASNGNPKGPELPGGGSRLWKEIVIRVEALGGLAVRLEEWNDIPKIVEYPTKDGFHSTWLRHGLTWGARAGLWTDGNVAYTGMLAGAAREVVGAVPALRPDAGSAGVAPLGPGDVPEQDDPVLDSILQFDMAWCISMALPDRGRGRSDAEMYPSFSSYYGHRSTPIADLLIKDRGVRAAVLGQGVTDKALATAIQEVVTLAGREAMGRGMFAHDFVSSTMNALFVEVGTT